MNSHPVLCLELFKVVIEKHDSPNKVYAKPERYQGLRFVWFAKL